VTATKPLVNGSDNGTNISIATCPEIISTTPSHNSNNITGNSNISITFSQAMSLDSVNINSIAVNGSVSGKMDGVFSLSGTNIISFNPDRNFIAGEDITVSITKHVENTLGKMLLYPGIVSFSISSASAPGAFAYSTDLPQNPYKTRILAPGDFNKDHFPDIIVGNNDQTTSLFLNNTTGNYSLNYNGLPDEVNFGSANDILTVDLNKDGYLDFVTGTTDYGINTYINNRTGSFTSNTINGIGTSNLKAGDLEGDGDIDIVVADASGRRIYILLND
jgi:hypothetical protein